MSAVAVESLRAGAVLKAIRLARRRGYAPLEIRVSYDDYFALRHASWDEGPMQHCMQMRTDGRWTVFGVLLDFDHPPGTARELTLKYMGMPATLAFVDGQLAAKRTTDFTLGSIHKEPLQ